MHETSEERQGLMDNIAMLKPQAELSAHLKRDNDNLRKQLQVY